MNTLYKQRKSAIIKGELYLWTDTIHQWKHLLASEEMKMQIIQSLQWLKQRNLLYLYAYVIIPNHFISFGKYMRTMVKNRHKVRY